MIILEDHAIGLSTFTIMAGLGGSLGYAMGGLDWGVLGTVKAEVDFYFSKKFFFQLRFFATQLL